MNAGPLVVDWLDQEVGAEARAVAARGHVAAGAIHAVEAHLEYRAVGGRHAALLGQDAAHQLGVDVEGIEVDGRAAVERPVAGDVHAPVLHRRAAAAGAAHAHAAIVADLSFGAVDADEGGVHLGVGVGAVGVESGAVLLGHHQAEDRLAGGVGRIIDLQMRVGRLREHAVQRGRRPGACGAAVVRGLNVKLEDGAIGARRERRAEHPVAGQPVAVRSVVEHRRGREVRRVGGAGVAEEQRHGGGIGQFVHDARGDRDGLCRIRHGRRMSHAEDERGDVAQAHGIGQPGGSANGIAGRPVLAAAVVQGRVDQFQRASAPVVRGDPFPARQPARGIGQPRAHRPIAFVGVAHLVHRLALRVLEFDGFSPVGKLAGPAADQVSHVRVNELEHGHIRGNHQVAPCRNHRVRRKREFDAVGESPRRDVRGRR